MIPDRLQSIHHLPIHDAPDRAARENGVSLHEHLSHETDPAQREQIEIALSIAERIKEAGGTALVVGGYVRDLVLQRRGEHRAAKDIDLEVYGLSAERVQRAVEGIAPVNVVGAAFSVIKVGSVDVALPRRDSKVDEGHRGFAVEADATLTIPEAARRRDFTVNAMLMDPLTGEIVDPYGGLDAIDAKVLRAVDLSTFGEDPLRVYRAMRFAGQLGFTIDPETAALCRKLKLAIKDAGDTTDHDEVISVERIRDEWVRMLLSSERPSIGLNAARELGIIGRLHPELDVLRTIPQDKEHHPEGDVWTHTLMVVDRAAQSQRLQDVSDERRLSMMLAALGHDLGKATTTTQHPDGRITSHGHPDESARIASRFMGSIGVTRDISDRVMPLIREHDFFYSTKDPSDAALRRLSVRLGPSSITDLVALWESDKLGRGGEDPDISLGEEVIEKAARLGVSERKPVPFVRGQDLIDRGFKPGPKLGEELKWLYGLQIEGGLADRAQAIDSIRIPLE